MDAQGCAKLSEFVLPRMALRNAMATGCLPYLAPELLAVLHKGSNSGGTSAITNRADVYSVALVMWEMLAGKQPFGQVTDAGMITAVGVCFQAACVLMCMDVP
jgi:serine/threonine protein kinase